MNKQYNTVVPAIARLVPNEPHGPEVDALSPITSMGEQYHQADMICTALEEMSRHLKWLDDDYQSGQWDGLEARARSIVMLADQMGLRRVGQVAADVVYCVDSPDEIALSATVSRLLRLMTQVLDHAAAPTSAF